MRLLLAPFTILHYLTDDEEYLCFRFFSAQRPPVMVPSDPPVNHLKPLAIKKGRQEFAF